MFVSSRIGTPNYIQPIRTQIDIILILKKPTPFNNFSNMFL